jgi:hypothetical protein
MGKWMNETIISSHASPSEDHIPIEDLARLAEGVVDKTERQHLLDHLNRCQRCYRILQETLVDISVEAPMRPVAGPWWKTRLFYALAVSILLVMLVGGPPALKYWTQRSSVMTASLDLDPGLKDILMENDALKWKEKGRINRLVSALQQRGLEVKDLDVVVLAKPYYQKKSLFGPKEVLHIRIENKVAYLDTKEK